MDDARKDLQGLLQATAVLAREVAGRLREREDWQYAAAVGLRAYAETYARHLPRHLRREQIDDLAYRLTHHAAVCTRELAPLAPLWERAGVLAWQIRRTTPPPVRIEERVNRVLGRLQPRPSVSFSSQSLLRALFVG